MVAVPIAAALALSACGSSSSSDDTTAQEGSASTTEASAAPATLTPVTVAIPQITGFFTLLWGMQNGYFEDEGIDLQLNAEVAGASIVPTVASGTLNIGGTVWAGMMPAVAQGLPLVGIAGITDARTPDAGDPSTEDDGALVWMADKGITSVSDMRGQTIAVPNVASLAAVAVHEIARAAGVPTDEYELVQVEQQNMAAALRSEQVDAAFMTEPFITILKGQAEVTILPEATMAAGIPGMPLTCLVANSEWAADNPELVAALQRAVEKITDYMNEHPDEVRAALPDVLGLPADVAEAVVMPVFNANYDAERLQALADLMTEHGIVTTSLDMSEYSVPMP